MNSVLKQRLVGATVLVALGVIFVPMLLERGADDSRLSVRMEIPPKPRQSVPDKLDKPPKVKPIEPLQPLKKALAKVKPAKTETPTKTKSASITDTPPKSKPVKTATKTKKPKQSASSTVSQPTHSQSTAVAGDKWIVQIGSFSRQANAEVLRDKLKSSGYAAYMESAQANTGPVYRVRIGPIKDRAAAEALIGKLAKQGGYRAIILTDE